ncbi:PREDICTED: mediator of RNA polymerase II transcription subunit 15a-like isoform X2 [Erythranthe guttata]|uniref:mediator of RNA polymerase II transcription subunit 15a-like isoform X2 n=1 Tax=Erythranthe guttata TaxID=4155 RepID=UPI00064E06DF|nr:PREDICTED: mediator of RNA polymerase II transcription subunit 15a-like isoform X2 [Erythranthe guttata]|eukprot:XP_012849946.1 PREDICTED: mediator of RNA polymerase II transcription subunit 15a-like isoform X2 [Erythranthe guttata]
MDGSNLGAAAQGQAQIPGQVMGGVAAAAAGTEGSDWRNHLSATSRQKIVNKIMEHLKMYLPFSGELDELKRLAVNFEEKMYTKATSQSNYLMMISVKMLTMDAKSRDSSANSRQSSNAARNSENPQEPVTDMHCFAASQSVQIQMQNRVQQLQAPMVSDESQVRQQLLSHNSARIL